MNSTARCTEIAGLLDALGSFTEEEDVMARSFSLRVSVFTEIEWQENRSSSPGPLALLLLTDEIKLGQVVHGLPCEGLDHVKPKSFSIIENRKIHETKDMGKGQESQYRETAESLAFEATDFLLPLELSTSYIDHSERKE
jgi:hypothetical protein